MTREEKIGEAARKYIDTKLNLNKGIKSVFIDGVQWADENPNLESLWHYAIEEEPKKGEYILVEVVNTLIPNEIGYHVEYVEEWMINLMKTEGFKCRWAYINDLLPKGGEK